MGHRGDRVETSWPVEFYHRGGAERRGALSLHLHDGDNQAVGGGVGRADEGSQSLGREQQLGGVLGQALLPFAPTSQVHEDIVVVGQATDFIIRRQARLEPAEGADDDPLGRVPEVYDLVEAFGADPVAALQNLGLPLLQVVPIVTDLTLKLIGDLRLCRLFQRLAGHLGLLIQSFVGVPGWAVAPIKESL